MIQYLFNDFVVLFLIVIYSNTFKLVKYASRYNRYICFNYLHYISVFILFFVLALNEELSYWRKYFRTCLCDIISNST